MAAGPRLRLHRTLGRNSREFETIETICLNLAWVRKTFKWEAVGSVRMPAASPLPSSPRIRLEAKSDFRLVQAPDQDRRGLPRKLSPAQATPQRNSEYHSRPTEPFEQAHAMRNDRSVVMLRDNLQASLSGLYDCNSSCYYLRPKALEDASIANLIGTSLGLTPAHKTLRPIFRLSIFKSSPLLRSANIFERGQLVSPNHPSPPKYQLS
jgi:hypothetical protein